MACGDSYSLYSLVEKWSSRQSVTLEVAGPNPVEAATADSAAIDIDVPVQIRRQFYGFSTIRKILNKILKFADRTEKCEIRRDSCAMGGNVIQCRIVLTEFEIGDAV